MEENKYQKFNNISISETGLFSIPALEFLKVRGILTISQLFTIHDKVDFIEMFTNQTKKTVYREIDGTTKLLRYKYLNEDLPFDLKELTTEELGHALGLSTRSYHCLKRKGINGEKLIEIMTSEKRDRKLKILRNLGDYSLNEIITKYTIVKECCAKRPQEIKDIKKLEEELKRLLKESEKITNQINNVQVALTTKKIILNDYEKKRKGKKND